MYFQWENFTDTQQSAAEILQVYQVTAKFYQEVKYREEFEQHCQWYAETAERHQQELQKMRGDLNIFGWFLRGRGTN